MDTTEVLPDGKTEAEEVHGQACVVTYCLVILMILGLTVVTILCMPGCKTPKIPDIPMTSTTIPPDSSGLDLDQVVCVGGAEWRNAKETVKLTGLSWAGSVCNLTWDTHDWETHSGAGGNVDEYCDGMVCAVYQRPDGSWMGGKFDHCPKGRTGYGWELKHVSAGYKGHIAPEAGAKLGLFIASYDGAERSTIQWTEWK